MLAPYVRRGIKDGLGILFRGSAYRRSPMRAELANSTDLIGRRWAAHYTRKLGEGIGEASADGMLVSLATVQRWSQAETMVWRAVHSAAGLPPGQSTTVLRVIQNRWNAYLNTRRQVMPLDLAADVAKVLLSRRARAIHANESVVARNFGTQLLLMNAESKGFIPKGSRKVWVTAVDERVCPVCAPMDSVAVGIEETFHVRSHRGVLSRDTQLWVPPAHPGCRCRIVPESAIEHGIITRTARFSRGEEAAPG